jgi:hypothetical protein
MHQGCFKFSRRASPIDKAHSGPFFQPVGLVPCYSAWIRRPPPAELPEFLVIHEAQVLCLLFVPGTRHQHPPKVPLGRRAGWGIRPGRRRSWTRRLVGHVVGDSESELVRSNGVGPGVPMFTSKVLYLLARTRTTRMPSEQYRDRSASE